MAINFLRLGSLGRSQGKVLAAALAYLEREELEDRRTGLVYDYRKRSGLVAKGAFFPRLEKGEWIAQEKNLSRQEKEKFCFEVELSEKKKNSRLAKEVLAAIPVELPQEKQLELAQIFAKKLVERYRVGAFWAVHEPPEGGDKRNVHLHLLLTTRELGSGNLGRKVRELDSKSEMQLIKKTWQELANEFLPEGKKLEEPRKDPLAEPKLPHLGREATWFERQTGQKSRKRLEFEAQLREWQTLTSELRELERQWQAELEQQRQQQEQERQAELERQRELERQAEYQKKYSYFASVKKLVNRYKNPQIGTDQEGEILLPDQTLKFSELNGYSLESLQEVYQATRRKIERDLERRIGQLPPVSRQVIGLRPLKELTDESLIELFPRVLQLEQSKQAEHQKQEAERKRLQQELERRRLEQERQRQQQEQKRQAEREKLRREQEELNKKYRFFYVTKKLVNLVNNPLIGLDTERDILLPDKTLKLSELKDYSLDFLEQSFLRVRRQVEEDLSRRISQLPPEMRELLTRPVAEIEKMENLDLIGLITEVSSLETLAQEEQERQREEQKRRQEKRQRAEQKKPQQGQGLPKKERLREKLERRRENQEEGNPNQINYPIRKCRPPDLEWE